MKPMSLPPEMPEALRQADKALQQTGTRAEDVAWTLLQNESHAEAILALKAQAGLQGDELERLLVWHAVQQALPQIPSLPVCKSVQRLLERELRCLHSIAGPMETGSYHCDRAFKMATLRRFPAGPMEWEISGIPRSYILQASFPANLRLLMFVISRVGGRTPCLFMHVAPSPKNRALTIPKEVLRGYYRMAQSLKLQPTMRAILAHAWFHDPVAVRDYPHLEILNQPYIRHGGLITVLGPAPASSGVLEGNAQRKADYLAGKIHYRYGFAIWPRDAAIKWAEDHPDLED
jgi:hypothetical protein